MASLSLSRGDLSIRNLHKLSSHNSVAPNSSLHYRTKNVSFATNPHGNQSKNLASTVKSQCVKPQEPQQRFSSPDSPPSAQPGQLPSRVYVGYSVYKGKAALTCEPFTPEFTPLGSGAFKLSKEGFILLQFAPAVGVRQYDWSRKQVFSLSVPEIGSIISLGPRDSCEFFHDPNKGRSDEGKVRKILKVEPLPDGSGHFFNLSVQNKILNVDGSIYIPITKAEFAVLVSSFNFIIPYLIGWHTFASTIKAEDANRPNSAYPKSADFEWNR